MPDAGDHLELLACPRIQSCLSFICSISSGWRADLDTPAPFVSGSPGSLVAPHADARFDIPLIVPALSHLLVLRVCLVAFQAARRVPFRPASEATHADAVLLAKHSHHRSRVLAARAHSNEVGRILTFR